MTSLSVYFYLFTLRNSILLSFLSQLSFDRLVPSKLNSDTFMLSNDG